MIKRRLAITLCALTAITGCASMSRNQCAMADWQALGYQHGAEGGSASQFNNYQNSCAKHQIKADFSAFKTGYDQGLKNYCTYEQGLNAGKSAHNYNNHCTRNLFPEFAEGYKTGLNRYCSYDKGFNSGLKGEPHNSNCVGDEFPEYNQGITNGLHKNALAKTIEETTTKLNSIRNALNESKQNITKAEQLIISETSTSEQRKQALQEIKYYKKKELELENEFHNIEEQRQQEQAQFDQM